MWSMSGDKTLNKNLWKNLYFFEFQNWKNKTEFWEKIPFYFNHFTIKQTYIYISLNLQPKSFDSPYLSLMKLGTLYPEYPIWQF